MAKMKSPGAEVDELFKELWYSTSGKVFIITLGSIFIVSAILLVYSYIMILKLII